MGINNLWSIYSPYVELKPIHFLRGQRIAIDLPSIVNESLGVSQVCAPMEQHLK